MRPEQKAWDDWNRWGDSVTQTPMIREAHRAGYRRALEDVANGWQQGEWAGALSGTQRPDPIQARLAAAQAVTDWLRARAVAPDPRETKD